jgi:hypothetical protein
MNWRAIWPEYLWFRISRYRICKYAPLNRNYIYTREGRYWELEKGEVFLDCEMSYKTISLKANTVNKWRFFSLNIPTNFCFKKQSLCKNRLITAKIKIKIKTTGV